MDWKKLDSCSRRDFLKISLLTTSSLFFGLNIFQKGDWAANIELKKWNEASLTDTAIKIAGVGGAGGFVLNHMIESSLGGINFVAINTDPEGLEYCKADEKVLIQPIPRGLGIDPEIVSQAIEEEKYRITKVLRRTEILFIVGGMGGATGTGASPVIAETAKAMGIFTIAIVSMPFVFEGRKRLRRADRGLLELKKKVDTMIVIPNQRLLPIIRKITLFEALGIVDDISFQAIKTISSLFLCHDNMKTIMAGSVDGRIGIGIGKGKNRALKAALTAISYPLLDNRSLKQARRILVNITGGEDMAIAEVSDAFSAIVESAGKESEIIFGTFIEPKPKNEIQVTIIAI